jgi:ribosome-associated translation inhibitor RaiA
MAKRKALELAKPERHPPIEWLRFLAKPGAKRATLTITAGGGSLSFTVRRKDIHIAIESAGESLRRMDDPKADDL